ncbi:MAG: putative metal-binding motif-containing protein [Alphaproteobacteria bacterium]|nr:putative metal-binding motif-containing protein [Alphaproteobacteria bacterium]
MPRASTSMLLLLVVACGEKDSAEPLDSASCASRTSFADADGDGFGDPAVSVRGCALPEGYVYDATDCDDADATIAPWSEERCDGHDQDCDGAVDEGAESRFFPDADGDGYGNWRTWSQACEAPEGYVADGSDCDDADAEVHPDAPERCDGDDQDCDAQVDEDAPVDEETGLLFHPDRDGDGYGDAAAPLLACLPPEGYVLDDQDCDDADSSVHPGATELCADGVDSDCDGVADCDTSDCVAESVCTGVEAECLDGADNDLDGLVDCEDGDCAADPICTGELACADGLDDDSDGQVDCEDDDCWGTSACGVVTTARLAGGGANRGAARRLRRWDRYRATDGARRSSEIDLHEVDVAFYDLSGTARVIYASDTVACGWTLDTMLWVGSDLYDWRRSRSSAAAAFTTTVNTDDALPQRLGFAWSSACSLSAVGSSVLPADFLVAFVMNGRPIVLLDGRMTWYVGAGATISSFVSSSFVRSWDSYSANGAVTAHLSSTSFYTYGLWQASAIAPGTSSYVRVLGP